MVFAPAFDVAGRKHGTGVCSTRGDVRRVADSVHFDRRRIWPLVEFVASQLPEFVVAPALDVTAGKQRTRVPFVRRRDLGGVADFLYFDRCVRVGGGSVPELPFFV